MWDKEDIRAFQEVQGRVAADWYVVTLRYDKWVYFDVKIKGPDGENANVRMPHLMVYLEWLQIYGEHPKSRRTQF